MCLYSFIVELNIWKKKSAWTLVYEGQELLSVNREILAKSRVHHDRSILLITVWFTLQDLQGCHTDASQEGYVSMPAAHVSPHYVIGKAKPGGGTTTMPSLQPQDMIQPDRTSDDSPFQPGCSAQAQSSFSTGYTPALPIPAVGGNPGTDGPTAPLLSTTPALLKTEGGFVTHLKSGSSGLEVYDTMKSRIMLTNLSVKAGPNFSNEMSRLNLTFSRQGRGQLVASERNRTKLIMRQYCLI